MASRGDNGTGWTVGQGARALGIPERRLEGWVERDVLRPSVKAKGTGTRRRFSFEDLIKAVMIEECRRLFGREFRPGRLVETIDAMGKTSLTRDQFVRLQVIRGCIELEPLRFETIVGGVLPRQPLTAVFNLVVIRTCLKAALGEGT